MGEASQASASSATDSVPELVEGTCDASPIQFSFPVHEPIGFLFSSRVP